MQHDMSFQVLVDEVRPLIKELTVLQVKQKFDNGENLFLLMCAKIMNGLYRTFQRQFILAEEF